MSEANGPYHLGLELAYMAAQTELTDAQTPEAKEIAQLKADEAVRLIGELLADID